MRLVNERTRRAGLLAGIGVTAAILGGVPQAAAEPEPAPPVINCDAAGYQRVAAGVALTTADYMDEHPDVRDAYTAVKSDAVRPNEQVLQYLKAHPDVAADMARLRQPLKDLMIRCGWAVEASES
jgi:hemophore-related protein